MITVAEEWCVIDKWWTPIPDRTWYAEVLWNGREIMFKRTTSDKVWRIITIGRKHD